MNNEQIKSSKETIDLKEIILSYLKHWKWFLLCCVLAGALAYTYLRYATPEYSAQAKIIFVDENEASSPGSVLMKDIEMLSGIKNEKIKDEIEVIKSRKLLAEVVKSLKLNIQFFKKGRIHDTELYPDAPIAITFIEQDSLINESRFDFFIDIVSNTEFNYSKEEDGNSRKITFGEKIASPVGDIILTPESNNILSLKGEKLHIVITPVSIMAQRYKTKLSISQVDEFSKVLNITLNDPVKEKAIKVIDELVKRYNQNYIDQKNEEAKNITDFLNKRLDLLETDLSSIDQSAEHFKTGNRLTDIGSEANIYLNSGALVDQQLAETKSQLNAINFMKESIGSQKGSYKQLPSNVGLTDPSINNISANYNEILRRRQELLSGSSGENSPMIRQLDQQLNTLRSSLDQSLTSLANTVSIGVSDLESRSAQINSKIYSVPRQQRQLKDIERKQKTKEDVYLFLLTKREEANISLSTIPPKIKVIDKAYSAFYGPVSPKPKMVYIAAIFLGLLLPFSIIYILDLLNNKIHNKVGLEKVLRNISLLGEIPAIKDKKTNTIIEKNDRSILAEAFRIVRTNLDYLRKVRKVNKNDNVVFVTSTIKGEGKTFFSMNLAMTFANSNKRVLVVGADIRSPRIHDFISNNKLNRNLEFGLTDYLFDESLTTNEVIRGYMIGENKIDILLPGKTPPNPAELLMSERMEELFDDVSSKYDVVIVDTAPTLLVTDTLLISQYAGHTIYLTRAGHTEKKLLKFAQELHDEGKLKGMMMVVNDVKQANSGYGGKYGYGYGVEKKRGLFRRKSA